jgi:archaellum biogenesis protein FlaJ (TadC family)
MREFWAFVMICATLFAAFATAMLLVILYSRHNEEIATVTMLMAFAGWTVAYLAFKRLMALPRKKEDIW